MRHGITPLAVLAVAAFAAGCGGNDQPTAATTRTTDTSTTPGGPKNTGTIGDGRWLADGTLAFRVTKLQRTTKPIGDPDITGIAPAPGEALVDVTIEVANEGTTTVQPFCSSGGRVLIDDEQRNYQPEQDSMYWTKECATIPPGGTRSYRQIFRVTEAARGFSVGFYDPEEEGDTGGYTYVVARHQ